MHPIFLTHGFLGYRKFLFWQMYPGVIEALAKRGITAYQPLVHPTASIEKRATQLLAYINETIGPEERFHVIAHSMGGLDTRYMISSNGLNQGHRVISLTTLSTPHHGSSLTGTGYRTLRPLVSLGAWLAHFLIPDPEQRNFLAAIGENHWDALDQLTPEYVQNHFNPLHPDDPRVKYFSYAGNRTGKPFRIYDILRIRGYRIIYPREGENDGMVSIQSAKWGKFRGVMKCDHGEIVGLCLVPWLENEFDHLTFLLDIANDLQQLEEELVKCE